MADLKETDVEFEKAKVVYQGVRMSPAQRRKAALGEGGGTPKLRRRGLKWINGSIVSRARRSRLKGGFARIVRKSSDPVETLYAQIGIARQMLARARQLRSGRK